MKVALPKRPHLQPESRVGRGIYAAPAGAVRIARCLLWFCVGGLVLTFGGQPDDVERSPRPLNTVEPPSTLTPAARLSQPGAPPDPESSASKSSVETLNEEEVEVARQLIRDYPKDNGTLLGFLAHIYSKHGLNKEAVRYWEQSLSADPNRADTYDAMATEALARQDYDRALELAHKAITLSPSLISSRRSVAESLIGLGRLQEALNELHQALKAAPRDVELRCLTGLALAQSGELDAARKSYEAALEIEPRHAPACYQLSIVFSRLNLPEQATFYRERFVSLRRGVRDKDQKWVDDYDDLLLVRQQVAETCDTAARYYRAHQNQHRAKELWLRAAALDPRHVASRLQLAALYAQEGQPKEALEFCKQAEEIAPQEAAVHLNVGILAAQLRRLKFAEAALRKACTLAPDNADAARLLSQVLLEANGDEDEAAALAQKAVDRSPVAENYYVLGAAEAHRGDRAAAINAMRRAVNLAPTEQKYRVGLKQLESSR